MAAAEGFRGFGPEGLDFLAGLREHNNKAWFDEHRSAWDDHLLGPAKDFVEAAGDALTQIAPQVRAEPRVNGSIFRINRDTRFSKDKTPYKDHLDVWFWDGTDRKSAVTGYFMRLEPDAIHLGVGAHAFTPEQLTAYRGLVVGTRSGPALRTAVEAVAKAGFPIKGEHYKRIPKGFEEPADPVVGSLLRHNALWVGEAFDHPGVLGSARLVSWCMTRWRKLAPLHDWLRDNVQ